MRPVGLGVALTLLARGERQAVEAAGEVWDAVVRSRAVVLDEMASRHRTIGAAGPPKLGSLHFKWPAHGPSS
jgi:hypothetical protein